MILTKQILDEMDAKGTVDPALRKQIQYGWPLTRRLETNYKWNNRDIKLDHHICSGDMSESASGVYNVLYRYFSRSYKNRLTSLVSHHLPD